MKHLCPQAVAAACLATMLMSGCASTTQLVPKPDQSGITPSTVHVEIRRSLGFGGWANALEVQDNGTPIGDLGPNGSLLWEREAGPMNLVVGPKRLSMGNLTDVNMTLQGSSKYSFTASIPFWYPISRNGVKHRATAKLSAKAAVPEAAPAPVAAPAVSKPPASDSDGSINKLRELKKLKDEGILTEDEYERRRKALVETL